MKTLLRQGKANYIKQQQFLAQFNLTPAPIELFDPEKDKQRRLELIKGLEKLV